MDESTVTLVVGLAGIVSTLIVSGLGLYYTAKSRNAPLRESLFEKQLEMAIEIVHLQSRIRVFATILSSGENDFRLEAREGIGECYRKFAEAEERSAVLLPVELWVEVKGLSNEISYAIGEYDEKEIIDQPCMRSLVARMTKVALLTRVVVGTDELTEQSLALFSSQKAYSRAANLEVAHFEEMHSRVNSENA